MTVKYQVYPEYKDSGVEWLGEVPNNWRVKKLKYICDVKTGTKDTVNAIDDGHYPFFVRSQTIEKINSIGADCEAVLTAGDGVGVGKVFHYYNGKFDFHQRVYMLNNFSGVMGKFVYYYLLINFYKVALEGTAKSTVDSLRLPQFLNFEFSLPDKKTQKKIIDFLDNETAKIDILIEKQQLLIKLLKEKRQAVISHAVTKGLNPDAPMRDSGVDWLGKVPEHWKLIPLKYLCKFNGGGTPSKENLNYWSGGNIPWVSPKDMKTFWLTDTQDKLTDIAVEESSTNFVENGALLMVVRSGILQRKIPIAINRVRITLNQDMKALRFNSLMDVEYAANFILGYQNSLLLEWSKEGATVESIEQEYLSGSLFPVPPVKEQISINNYIKKRMNSFRNLEEHSSHGITLLKERRTALISAAVTGKIDVRNWQHSEQSNKKGIP